MIFLQMPELYTIHKNLKVNYRGFLYKQFKASATKHFTKTQPTKHNKNTSPKKAFKAQKRPRIWKNQNNTLILHLIS